MIVLVAPYSPPNRPCTPHLGASRKIEIVISILAKIGLRCVLVNSAHNSNQDAPLTINDVKIGGVPVTEITPATSQSRGIGKFKNLLFLSDTFEAIKKIGHPQLCWLYNGYAFEMAMAQKIKSNFDCPTILEFEDWHFSRSRGFNPKPYIDYVFWRLISPKLSGSFCVNNFLHKKMSPFHESTYLLPGVVPENLNTISKTSTPFRKEGRLDVGFFGGLSDEKGADIVLSVASRLSEHVHIHVTGSGPLSGDFEEISKSTKNLHYYGRVDDKTLYSLIEQCDILLNPHASILGMGNGIFPFKVVEAIASGRLLISTPVPHEGLEELVSPVCFVSRTPQDFLTAINGAKNFYAKNHSVIRRSAELANELFGEDALLSKIKSFISSGAAS